MVTVWLVMIKIMTPRQEKQGLATWSKNVIGYGKISHFVMTREINRTEHFAMLP